MSKKITNVPFAVSPGLYDVSPEGSGFIKFEPFSALSKANSIYDGLPSGNDLSKSANSGEFFFYNVELFNTEVGNDRSVISKEKGIAVIFPSGSDLYLDRVYAFENQAVGEEEPSSSNATGFLSFDSERHVVISSYTPADYRHICAGEDSVLCTTSAFQPEPVELDPSGILGRKSGQITSLTGQDVL